MQFQSAYKMLSVAVMSLALSLSACAGPAGPAGADGADGQDGAPGADGQDGADGADGADGEDGADGNDGADGADGDDGLSALLRTTAEAPGDNCLNGGVKIESGIDDNKSGVLDDNEVDDAVFVCNGLDADQLVFDRLGGDAGIEVVIGDFVGRVLSDAKINGYFLNGDLAAGRLVTCLVKQVNSVTGGGEVYPGVGDPADEDGCRNMVESHAGLGISSVDFDDLVGHLVDALEAAGVAEGDIGVIAEALLPLEDQIVEDDNNNQTIYQRIGRKAAIEVVVADAINRIAGDATINGFFTATVADDTGARVDRLATCLERQVCEATSGPCDYFDANAFESALVDDAGQVNNCLSMLASHQGLVDSNDNTGIDIADFLALAFHFSDALENAGLPADNDDHQAIFGVLAGECPNIVADPTECDILE